MFFFMCFTIRSDMLGLQSFVFDDVFSVFLKMFQGIDSGYGLEDDTYNVYDKPWRAGGGASQAIYRPTKTQDKDIYGDDVEKLIKTSKWVCPFSVPTTSLMMLFFKVCT